MQTFLNPELIDRHRKILRRYLWTRRGSIRQVPELIAQGANNALYRFYIAGRPLLAKIGMNPFYRQLHIEYAVLCHAGAVGPVPVDYFDDVRSGLQVLLVEQLDGVHPFVLDDEGLRAAGRAIAAYHTCREKISEVPEEHGVSFISGRILRVRNYGGVEGYHDRFDRLYSLLLANADREGMVPDSGKSVLVHGDLTPRNIIAHPSGSLRIIDWEGARYDVPEADLATFVKAYHLEGERRDRFFAAYGLPVDRNIFNFRLAVHYVQVIAWRLAIQLPRERGDHYNEVLSELEEEFTAAEKLISLYP